MTKSKTKWDELFRNFWLLATLGTRLCRHPNLRLSYDFLISQDISVRSFEHYVCVYFTLLSTLAICIAYSQRGLIADISKIIFIILKMENTIWYHLQKFNQLGEKIASQNNRNNGNSPSSFLSTFLAWSAVSPELLSTTAFLSSLLCSSQVFLQFARWLQNKSLQT